jgi:hypothetical protein
MIVAFAFLLLFMVTLALGLGLLCMLRDLVERNVEDSPTLQDPIADNPEVRSQFSWQTRTHYRSRD